MNAADLPLGDCTCKAGDSDRLWQHATLCPRFAALAAEHRDERNRSNNA